MGAPVPCAPCLRESDRFLPTYVSLPSMSHILRNLTERKLPRQHPLYKIDICSWVTVERIFIFRLVIK